LVRACGVDRNCYGATVIAVAPFALNGGAVQLVVVALVKECCGLWMGWA